MKFTFYNSRSISIVLLSASLFTFSCKKDDDATSKVTVTSIKADGKELAGATSADKVPITSSYVITFSKAINAVSAADFTLTPTGGAAVPFTVSGSGMIVTMDPTQELLTGTNYALNIKASIKATDGGGFSAQTFNFKTDGLANVVPPQASRQVAYFGFNNSANSSVGTWTVTPVGTTYGTDRGGYANSAVSFNGTTDIIEVANGLALFGNSSTQSFWLKSDTTSGHGMFIMGMNFFKGSIFEIDGKNSWIKNGAGFATADGTTTTEDLFFNGDGKFKDNGGWQGHAFNTDNSATGGNKVVFANWVHVVHTYDASTKLRTLYVNGAKVMQSDFNLWPTGDIKTLVTRKAPQTTPTPENSNVFAFGFGKDRSATFWSYTDFGDYAKPNANHFKGQLDDVRFFDIALSAGEILTLYNAEK